MDLSKLVQLVIRLSADGRLSLSDIVPIVEFVVDLFTTSEDNKDGGASSVTYQVSPPNVGSS